MTRNRSVVMWLVVVAACSSTDASDEPTPPVALATSPPGGTTADTGPADDLAPSQIAVATVPPPTAPTTCDPTAVAVWTASARPDPVSGAADVTIRIEHDGTERCEIDISDSPGLDPDIEFDAWLEPGGGADLWVDATADDCTRAAEPLRSVPIVVNGRSVDVAVNTLAACDPLLVAFAPVTPPNGACTADDLAAVVTENPSWLLVRNESFTTCRPGELGAFVVGGRARRSASDAVGSSSAVERRAVTVLAPDDVVGVQLGVDTAEGCRRRPALIELGEAEIPVRDGLPDCMFVDPGPLVSYLSSPMGPLADLGTGDFDLELAVALLDPFGPSVGS